MFRALSAFIAIYLCLGLLGRAQTAPEIAPGITGDELVQVYGWPKGKSSGGDREIWVYETFNVRMEHGRVVSVSPILSPKKISPPVQKVQPKPLPSQQVQRPLQLMSPPSAISTHLITPTPPVSVQAQNLFQPTPREKIKPPANSSISFGLVTFWTALILAVTVGAGIGVARYRLRRDDSELAVLRTAASEAPRKTWQEDVADKIAKMPAIPIPTPTPTELSYELLDRLEWKSFELIVSLYFSEMGVRAECTCTGADGGIDVKLFKPGEDRPHAYIQCKAWEQDIDVARMRELFGVMAADKISEGVFATTGKFSEPARAFAEANGITAMTGRNLVERFNLLQPEKRSRILARVTEGDYTTPTCAKCDIKLVLSGSGNPFWRCKNFPRCSTKIYVRRSRRI